MVPFGKRPKRRKDGERAGAVEAAVVVADSDRLADFPADLDPHDVGLDQGAAGKYFDPQIRDERWQNHRTRVRWHHR
jgi:hypothetical protein